MTTVMLKPGTNSLADWRAVYRGAAITLDPDSAPRIDESAAAVERILAKGKPIYGVNTGFGKLASVRIEDADLATLQRNIVLSHAAGVGEPMPAPVVRGNKVDAEHLKELVPGTSTKADVTALIGSPTARDSFDDERPLDFRRASGSAGSTSRKSSGRASARVTSCCTDM